MIFIYVCIFTLKLKLNICIEMNSNVYVYIYEFHLIHMYRFKKTISSSTSYVFKMGDHDVVDAVNSSTAERDTVNNKLKMIETEIENCDKKSPDEMEASAHGFFMYYVKRRRSRIDEKKKRYKQLRDEAERIKSEAELIKNEMTELGCKLSNPEKNEWTMTITDTQWTCSEMMKSLQKFPDELNPFIITTDTKNNNKKCKTCSSTENSDEETQT